MKTSDAKILHYIYKKLYKKAKPKANFDKLLKNAPINEEGLKEIQFLDYTITQEQEERIIQKAFKKFRIKDMYTQKAIRVSIVLGCGPKYR